MKKVIIFDFDGTIADTFHFLKDFLKKNSFPDTALIQIREMGLDELFKRYKLPFWKIPFMVYYYKRSIKRRIKNHEARTFKGMVSLLSNLKKNYKLGIISTNSRENIEIFLKKENLERYFSFINGDISLFKKSNALKKVLKRLKIKADEIIYIGDEDRDVYAAKKIGITTIAVSWGYNSRRFLLKQRPNYIVNSPKEILSILR